MNKRILRFFGIALAAVAGISLVGFIVMKLWNAILPSTVGWHEITYWQALGLLILTKILFGFPFHRGGGPSRHWRRRMIERWDKMTPEEREKFREGMQGRCGEFRTPAAESHV
jgi:hypothetical protein